jgi:hypothetical protein
MATKDRLFVLVIVLVAIVLVATNLFLLLADNPSEATLDILLEQKADSLEIVATRQENIARKKEMRWEAYTDSLEDVIDAKPPIKIIYKQANDKIHTDTRSLNERELDSILTNYRFNDTTEKRNR